LTITPASEERLAFYALSLNPLMFRIIVALIIGVIVGLLLGENARPFHWVSKIICDFWAHWLRR